MKWHKLLIEVVLILLLTLLITSCGTPTAIDSDNMTLLYAPYTPEGHIISDYGYLLITSPTNNITIKYLGDDVGWCVIWVSGNDTMIQRVNAWFADKIGGDWEVNIERGNK